MADQGCTKLTGQRGELQIGLAERLIFHKN